MGDVVDLNAGISVSLDPIRVLNNAMDKGLETVVVIGFTTDGQFYLASSKPDALGAFFLLKEAEKKLMETCRRVGANEDWAE